MTQDLSDSGRRGSVPRSDDGLLAGMKLSMEREGLLPSSILKREIHLRALMRWLGPGTSILDITTEQIEVFLDGRDIGPRTRFTWLANLATFYRWALKAGLIDENPVTEIKRPKLRRTLPRPAAADDITRILEVAGPKERCWVLLAGLQGLRCQEIAGLRREDVADADGLLRVVHAKGGNERMVDLHPDVLAALQALPMPRTGWVFTRDRGGRYTPNALSLYFNRFLHDNGALWTAHQLRHFFGTRLYQSTSDLRFTQEMLGHSDPGTTAIYTAFNRRGAREAIRALNFDPIDPGPIPDAAVGSPT